jgi:hypothetical protein
MRAANTRLAALDTAGLNFATTTSVPLGATDPGTVTACGNVALEELVDPATYTLSLASSAMDATVSSPVPPK